MATRRPPQKKKHPRRAATAAKARARRSVAHKSAARARGGAATAAQAEAVWAVRTLDVPPIPPQLFTQSVIHVLGKTAGRMLCGRTIDGAPASPLQEVWGPLAERRGALVGVDEAIASAVLALPGSADPCRGCVANAARMQEADAAKMEGRRGAARTKAVHAEAELEAQRENEDDDA